MTLEGEMESQFVRSYIECALWSSTDGDGTPLDDSKYSDTELAEETLARFREDCARFQEQTSTLTVNYPESQVAHDFWLTRNRHGAGFWDGAYPKEIGDKLTEIAHSFGECDLYVGDDGKFYV